MLSRAALMRVPILMRASIASNSSPHCCMGFGPESGAVMMDYTIFCITGVVPASDGRKSADLVTISRGFPARRPCCWSAVSGRGGHLRRDVILEIRGMAGDVGHARAVHDAGQALESEV